MALNPRDLPSDKKAAEIAKLYAKAQRDIGLHVQRAVYAGLTATARNRRLQAAAILAYLDQLGAETDPLLRDLARQAIADGDALAEADVRRLGATLTASSAEFYAVNQEAVTAVEEAMRGRLDDARRTVGRSVNDVFRKATLEGTQRALLGVEGSPQKAARRLAKDLADRGQVGFRDKSGRMWKLKDYAEMATRTTTREAVVHGQVNRLLAHNISLVRISEHADSCPQCAPYQGRLIDLSGQITEWQGEAVASGPLPPIHPRCVAPGTVVSGSGIYGGFRSMYRGDLMYLTTAGGERLAVTPNHPVMTGAGWLPAGELRQGFHIACATEGGRFAKYEHLHDVPSLVEDVFDALGSSGGRTSVTAAGHDFHGDARHFQGEVDVVFANRGLLDELNAEAAEKFRENVFVGADMHEAVLVGGRAGDEMLGASLATSGCCVSCGGGLRSNSDTVAGKVFPHRPGGHVRVDGEVVQSLPGEVAGGISFNVWDRGLPGGGHPELFGACADLYPEALKLGAYANGARAELAGAVREGRAVGVHLDELVEVDRRFYSGHVFDLSAIDGNYCANTLIVSNCRHTIGGVSVRVEAVRQQLLGAA